MHEETSMIANTLLYIITETDLNDCEFMFFYLL